MNIFTGSTENMADLYSMINEAKDSGRFRKRPFVTLTYAQSLDGSISRMNKEPLGISGKKAFKMTHELRSIHDAILIGIGTVLSDNPMLTVRLTDGENPSPVILDTNQRISPESKMFQEKDRDFYIVSARSGPSRNSSFYREVGANLIYCPMNGNGLLDLNTLMLKLYDLGIHSIMVEGGAKVISSFLSSRLADILLLTISPRLIGGYNALSYYQDKGVKLKESSFHLLGEDLIYWGQPDWEAE